MLKMLRAAAGHKAKNIVNLVYSLWTVGNNAFGDLGDNTTVNKSSPIQTVAGGTGWYQENAVVISNSNNHTGAVKTDGTLWLWGYNVSGQLGDETTAHNSSPIQTVAGGTNWKQLSTNGSATAAIKTDGTLWLWGDNYAGGIGDNSTVKKSSPVQTVAGGTNWTYVASGGTHTAAIKTDGTLWMWGRNNDGQLGDNTIDSKSSPIQTVAGGTNWTKVVCGYNFTAAIKTDGTLWMWGRNNFGQLGDNTIDSKSSPIQTVAGGTNWKQVNSGQYHSSAIKTDGTLWTWGINSYGQLGDNTVDRKSSPVQTVAGGTNWKQVSCGYAQTNVVKTDGTLWGWGYNSQGGLGDNTIAHKSSPVQTVATGENWVYVYSNSGSTTAISSAVATIAYVYFDDTYWVNDYNFTWSGTQWDEDGLGVNASILTIGTWDVGFRPSSVDISYFGDGAGNHTFRIYDAASAVIGDSGTLGPGGGTINIPLTFAADDINKLDWALSTEYAAGNYVSNIVFYD